MKDDGGEQLMFEFNFFDPQIGPLVVSIAEYGLTFSRAAIEAMGRPKFVKLGFDKKNLAIGIQPVNEDDDKRISFIEKEKNGYIRLNNKEFIRFIMRCLAGDEQKKLGSKAIRYLTYWDEELSMLIVDLKKPLDKSNEDEQQYENN
jgi:hypothetical protein